MRLRSIGLIVTLGILLAPFAVDAQQAAKVFRIDILWIASPEDPWPHALLDAFQQGLREQGYVEGQNVAFEHRYAKGKFERFQAWEWLSEKRRSLPGRWGYSSNSWTREVQTNSTAPLRP